MGTPPPSPRPASSQPEEKHSYAGAILYGVVFLVAASVILTKNLRTAVQPAESTGTNQPATPVMPTLPLTYPKTRAVDASDMLFGVKVADPYRWLEDGKSPEVQTWLTAQNKLARSYLDALPGRAALEKRFRQLL